VTHGATHINQSRISMTTLHSEYLYVPPIDVFVTHLCVEFVTHLCVALHPPHIHMHISMSQKLYVCTSHELLMLHIYMVHTQMSHELYTSMCTYSRAHIKESRTRNVYKSRTPDAPHIHGATHTNEPRTLHVNGYINK